MIKQLKKKYQNELPNLFADYKFNSSIRNNLQKRIDVCNMILKSIKRKIKVRINYLEFSPREITIIEMRFGLNNNVSMTLEEVSREFNVTRERIRSIECKFFERLNKIK